MQTIMLIILKLKTIIKCREINIEIGTNSGYPAHELMNHHNSLHNNLIERCMKCMHRKYSGYHFLDKCKVNSTGLITSVHRYIDYTDINYMLVMIIMITKYKDKDDLNKVLNSLKDNIIENLTDYIKNESKTEILNEIKTEIINDLKTETNIKKKSNEVDNKTTRGCCLCKTEKNRDCFYTTGGLCTDCCSQKVSCPICNIVINRSSLNKHKKGHIVINPKFLTIFEKNDYKLQRLHKIT